jgi:hypothetical protein
LIKETFWITSEGLYKLERLRTSGKLPFVDDEEKDFESLSQGQRMYYVLDIAEGRPLTHEEGTLSVFAKTINELIKLGYLDKGVDVVRTHVALLSQANSGLGKALRTYVKVAKNVSGDIDPSELFDAYYEALQWVARSAGISIDVYVTRYKPPLASIARFSTLSQVEQVIALDRLMSSIHRETEERRDSLGRYVHGILWGLKYQ